ncbi:O-antigen polymerase [Blautia producta]|uniref:O-antigen polymerase n=1 Tax=Blautia producta TaxID=33035 RepID=UPI0031B58D62
MIFILFIILFIALIFTFLYERYILHPAVIVIGLFLFSTFAATMRYRSWGDINIITVIVILISCIVFVVGTGVGEKVKFKIRTSAEVNEKCSNTNRISRWKSIIIIIFMILITVLEFTDVVKFASGRISGFVNIITSARHNSYVQGDIINHTVFVQQGLYFSRAIAYIYIYNIANTIHIKKEKILILDVIPIFIYFVQALLSTGRTELIYIIYSIIFINYCVLMDGRGWKIVNNFKFLRGIVLGLIVFFAIFIFFGNARSGNSYNALDSVTKYVGSSFIALDNYISDKGLGVSSAYFGEYTQYLYYQILNAMGQSDKQMVNILPILYIGEKHELTNVYTSLGRYIHDYSIWGTLLIMFFLGILYSKAFKKIQKNTSKFGIVLYAYISYPLIEIAIEERVFSNFLTARTVFIIMYLFLAYKLLIKETFNNSKYEGF